MLSNKEKTLFEYKSKIVCSLFFTVTPHPPQPTKRFMCYEHSPAKPGVTSMIDCPSWTCFLTERNSEWPNYVGSSPRTWSSSKYQNK